MTARPSQEVPMPPALSAFFCFDFDFILTLLSFASFHSLYHFHLIMACIPQLFPFAFAPFTISALLSTPLSLYLSLYLSLCLAAHLHYQLRTYKITRDTLWRVATHRILCLSLFLRLFTVWIGNGIGLKQQQSESKTKLVFICMHTHKYTCTYTSVYRVDNNSCLLSVLVFCFYFQTRFLALCPFLGMVLSIHTYVCVHYVLGDWHIGLLSEVNALLRMQSQKRWKLHEI